MRRTWLGTPCRIFQVFTFQLKEEPYSRRQSFGSIYVLINYFSLVIGKDLVHLRLACHMDTISEISTGLISFATLIWVVIASLTENSLPSHIILKFHLACDADAERDPSGEKNKNLT